MFDAADEVDANDLERFDASKAGGELGRFDLQRFDEAREIN